MGIKELEFSGQQGDQKLEFYGSSKGIKNQNFLVAMRDQKPEFFVSNERMENQNFMALVSVTVVVKDP